MAAEQHGLRHHRELVQRNPEREPRGGRRQQIAHVGHGFRRRRLAPGNAEADLEHAGRLHMAGLDEFLGQQQMPGLEHFQLREHTRIADRDCHGLQVVGRIDEHARAHVEAAHVEAADFRAQFHHVAHALLWPPQCRGRAGLGRVIGIVHEARARTGGEVDQHVGAARTDAFHHLAVVRAVHAGLGGLGIAHMDVDDRGASLGGVDARSRDLRRGDGYGGVLAGRVGRARHRARDHHLALHVGLPPKRRAATSARRELYASSARNPKLREDALLLLFSLSRTWGGGSGRGLVPQALFCGTGPSRRASHVDLPRKRGEVKRA